MYTGTIENSTININHDYEFMKRYVSIIIQIWITPTCAKCERSQGWAGLGRTTTGAGTMLLCADPRQGAGATGPQSSILQFCPDIFVVLTIPPGNEDPA